MPPNDLIVALNKLQALPISKEAKKAIENTLKAGANPHSESIDVVIKSLPKKQRGMIEKTAKGLRDISADVQARGRKKLEAISDEEWQRLLDDGSN